MSGLVLEGQGDLEIGVPHVSQLDEQIRVVLAEVGKMMVEQNGERRVEEIELGEVDAEMVVGERGEGGMGVDKVEGVAVRVEKGNEGQMSVGEVGRHGKIVWKRKAQELNQSHCHDAGEVLQHQ